MRVGGCHVVIYSVAEHWLHKPGVLGSIPSDCQPFHFLSILPHNIQNSSILANSHSYLNYFFCILVCNDLAYHNHGEERLSVVEGPQSHSKEHQVRKQECKWQPVKGKSTGNKVNQLLINTISLFPML